MTTPHPAGQGVTYHNRIIRPGRAKKRELHTKVTKTLDKPGRIGYYITVIQAVIEANQ